MTTKSKPPEPYYRDESCTIYHGDCRHIIEHLTFDVIVTDPPYGIDAMQYRRTLPDGVAEFSDIKGDTDIAAVAFVLDRVGHHPATIFGANNFPSLLPHRGRWVCWDKRLSIEADRMLGSAFELAWRNVHSGYDTMIRCLHGGVVNANAPGRPRQHPTEKPVTVMQQLIELTGPGVVLDPFMGSGTTLRAAKDLGRKAIGIELEERYCEIAVKRLAQGVLDFG